MPKNRGSAIDIDGLRRRAEGQLNSKAGAAQKKGAKSAEPPDRILHELEVHRIELQMQNDELRRTTETLESAMAEYSELYDFAPVGYFTLDRNGGIQRLNLTGARLLGVERALVVRRRFDTFVSASSRRTFEAFLAKVFEPGHEQVIIENPAPTSCEVALEPKRPGGLAETAVNHLHVRLTAALTDNKEACRVMAMDVTELKRLHEQVLLSDRLSSLGLLAAGIAHEINNPLAVVIGNLDATLEHLRRVEGTGNAACLDLPTTLETLGDCLEGAARMAQIVRDLKVFSRSDEERFTAVDLRGVVRASLKLVNNEIRHRATLVTEFDEVPPVLGNEARVGQVVLNLLVNAVQSLPEGDVDGNTITVRTRTHVTGRALLEVCDTGPGIPDAIMAHIFEPFFTTKPIGIGTGLGLAICRQIVTGLGGEIAVDTQVGVGTRFRVLLPADTSAGVAFPEYPALQPSVRRGRILLIDDDPAVLKTVTRTLSARHDVVPIVRAREAVERISAGEAFDLIISDVMMPGMTGMELYEALAAIAPRHAQRMIFLTGGAFTPGARAFLSRIDNLCFDKPFDSQNLLRIVDSLVASQDPPAHTAASKTARPRRMD